MPKTRQQKETTKAKLVDVFKRAKSVVFADYRGLTVAQADVLRKATRLAKVEYIVAKKSLLTLAAKEAGYEVDAKKLPGMLGTAFGLEDEVAPAKVLGDMSKVTKIILVGGIFEGIVVGQDKVIALSKLPSRLELLGKVVGTIYAPVSAFVRALNAIRESKDAGAAPAKVEEAPAAPVAEVPAAAPEAPVAEAPVQAVPAEAPQTAATEAPATEQK
ncbi:MAG: 50S ribosomal protein L10 [Patescibacteria group bacterium]